MPVVGQVAYLEPFELIDSAGDLITGKVTGDWTKTLFKDGAKVGSPPTITVAEVSGASGTYATSFTPASAGEYRLALQITVSGKVYRFSEPFTVVAAAADPASIRSAIDAMQTDITTVKANADVATSTRSSAAVWTSGRAERLDRIGADSVTVRSATAATELIQLRQGADYSSSVDNVLEWDVTTDTDLSPVGTVVTLTISSRSLSGDDAITATCDVTNPAAATKTLTAELNDTQTSSLRTSEFTRYQIDAQIGTDTVPLVEGRVKVLPALA